MRAAWRLSINALAGRRSRSALLAAAVALATALVAALSCALGSVASGLEREVASRLGRADVRIKEIAGDRFDDALLARIAQTPGVAFAAPRSRGPLTLRNPTTGAFVTLVGMGVDPVAEAALIDSPVAFGRAITADDEVTLDNAPATELGASLGDTLEVLYFGEPRTLRLVGIGEALRFERMRKPGATVTRPTLEAITFERGQISEIEIILDEGIAAEAWATNIGPSLPRNVMAEASARITSGVSSALAANRLLTLLASTLAYLAAAFIVLIGLTTNLQERQRELAILRCIGAHRRTLAAAQTLTGLLLGAIGAGVGVPLGIALAYLLVTSFPELLAGGLVVPAKGMLLAAVGSLAAGLLGALLPAITAMRVQPLVALASRAKPARARGVRLAAFLGLIGLTWQLIIVSAPADAAIAFWGYLLTGLPLMFFGYFLIGPALVTIIARLFGPPLARLLRLPPAMVVGTVRATPYRHGFSAGALMLGLAIMNTVWTNGSALLRDWLDALDFPDAFVHAWFGLEPEALMRIEALPFVTDVNAVTLFKIDNNAFGVQGLRSPPTFFVAFEPEPFFKMTNLHWIAGDPIYARRRLDEGGAVLVAKEFLIRREGFGIGDTFRVTHANQEHSFEIVGAISSPGLDVVSAYFDIGKEYANQAMSSVFGTRTDLERVFGATIIHMAQVGLKGDISDKEATAQIRQAVGNPAAIAGSGREIKAQITDLARSGMTIASAVAIAAMLFGCLGVANIVVAGIDARRFEFGILRAVGATPGTLAKLIYADTLLIALTACVLGTGLGLQGSWAGIVMYERLAGIVVHLKPPIAIIALGWLTLFTLIALTIAPIVIRLARQSPRELLGATKG